MTSQQKDDSNQNTQDHLHGVKILHFCAVDFTVRHFIAPLALDQNRLGAEVMIACTPGDEWQYLLDQGLSMKPVEMPRQLKPVKLLNAFWQLFKLLRKEKPDVLHVHTPLASLVGRLAGICARVPTVVYTVHGFYFHEYMKQKTYLVHLFLERFFAPFCHAMFFVSREDLSTAKKYGMKKPDKLFHTPNGVDENDFASAGELEKQFDRSANQVVVTFMGRLTEEKGIFEFLQAIESLAEEGLPVLGILAGPVLSSERDSVQTRIDAILENEKTKECIQQIGYCQNVPSLLMQSDIFCLPSYREGLPVSIIEAMMAKLPVVTTDVRGCRELVRNGVNGFIVKHRNADQLRDALSLLVRKKSLRQKMGQNGKRRALKYYTQKDSFESVHKAYGKMLNDSRGDES